MSRLILVVLGIKIILPSVNNLLISRSVLVFEKVAQFTEKQMLRTGDFCRWIRHNTTKRRFEPSKKHTISGELIKG